MGNGNVKSGALGRPVSSIEDLMSSLGGGATSSGGATPSSASTAPAATTTTSPAATTTSSTAWAKEFPTSIQQLLQQLSANSGQQFMPGGVSGSVRAPVYGSSQAMQINPNPFTYGQDGGEATFFSQALNGGMAPISAVPGLGSPTSWNPLGTSSTTGTSTLSSSEYSSLLSLIESLMGSSQSFGESGGGKRA